MGSSPTQPTLNIRYFGEMKMAERLKTHPVEVLIIDQEYGYFTTIPNDVALNRRKLKRWLYAWLKTNTHTLNGQDYMLYIVLEHTITRQVVYSRKYEILGAYYEQDIATAATDINKQFSSVQ